MLKSVMAFFDLVFPLKLKPLTYEMEGAKTLLPGTVVEAELKKTIRRALILDENLPGENVSGEGRGPGAGKFPTKTIKSVLTDGPAISAPLLGLLKWMAGYYMVPEGLALKVMFGGELFEKGKPRKAKRPERGGTRPAGAEAPAALLTASDAVAALTRIRQAQDYRAFLLHAPNGPFEGELALEASRDQKGVIVICPERSRMMEYERRMKPVFGERLCVLHGGLTSAKRRFAYEKILAGETDVVLGTRVAVFAPLRKVSLIILTGEEDPNYKNRQDVRYGTREVAVMRAWLEKARVLLSSICPSAESYLNALRGKYEYLRFPGEKPAVRVLLDSKKKSGSGLPAGGDIMDRAITAAFAGALEKGRNALLVANRPGHSVPLCEDCGHFERCPSCGTALVLHKTLKTKKAGASASLLCHHCGFVKGAQETCGVCGGHGLKPLGAGIERLKEEAERLLTGAMGIKIVDRGKKTEKPEDAPEALLPLLYLGTKRVSKIAGEAGAARPKIAALIYPESAFFRPGFRSRERVFAEINHLADRLSADGKIIIQTKTPELFRAMKELDYEGFMKEELEERKALGYPPFSKIAQITIEAPTKPMPAQAPPPVKTRSGVEIPDAQVLGPIEKTDEKGKKFFLLLVKAPTARALKAAVGAALRTIAPGAKVTVDIDPA